MCLDRKFLLLLAPFALVGVGCKPSAPKLAQAAIAPVPAGWTHQDNKKYGVSLDSPAGWLPGDDPMGGADVGNLNDPNNPLAKMMEANKQQQKEDDAKQAAEDEKKGILMRINLRGAKPIMGEERTHFTVKKVDNEWSKVEEAGPAVGKEYVGERKIEFVDLPVGKAAEITVNAKSIGGDELSQIIYVLLDGHDAYKVRFSSTNNPGVIHDVARPVMRTFRISAPSG